MINLIDEVRSELQRATMTYDPFNSSHEGFAVLLEEVDELWDEIKKKPAVRDPLKIRKEAIQVAAMALRIVRDCA